MIDKYSRGNGARNGIMLPPTRAAATGRFTRSSAHLGSHPNYTNRVLSMVNSQRNAYRIALQQGMDPNVARQIALRNLSSEIRLLRNRLRRGVELLN